MAVVGAAAAADDGEPRQQLTQFAIFAGKFKRIAGVQFGRRVELGMAAFRCVGADAAQAFAPDAAFFARLFRRKVMLTPAQYRKRFRMMRQALGGER